MKDRFIHTVRYYAFCVKVIIQHKIRNTVVPSLPHFDVDTQQYFLDRLSLSKSYLEFGSGGSTLLAAKLSVKTISVESSPDYAVAVRRALGLNSSVKSIYANIGLTRDWGHPVFNNPTKARVKLWYNYLNEAFRALENREFPDLILVDGRFRRACALHMANQAAIRNASTEILFDDYQNRKSYHDVEKYLGKPTLIGRSALFNINQENPPRIPSSALDEAMTDPN